MAGERFSGVAVGSIAAGVLFVYAGIRGYSIAQALKNIIQGTAPSAGQTPGSLSAVGIQSGIDPTGTATSGLIGTPSGTGSFTNLPTYTHAELMQLWQANGGSAGTANNAACHAMQESSGSATVTSSNPDGGVNVGLWQLDTKGVGAGHTVAELQNPNTNARITVMATGGGVNWSQWATSGC